MPPKRRSRGGRAKATSSRKPPVGDAVAPEVEAQASAGAEEMDPQDAEIEPAVEAQPESQQADPQADGTDPQAYETDLQSAPSTETPTTSAQTPNRPTSTRSTRGGASSSFPQPARGKKLLQPKFTNRRSETERNRLVAAEAERQKERDSIWNAQQAATRDGRIRRAYQRGDWNGLPRGRGLGRGIPGRGHRGYRGGYMGDHSTSRSAGPFSQASPFSEAMPKRIQVHRKAGVHRPSGMKEVRKVKQEGETATTEAPKDQDGDVEMDVGEVTQDRKDLVYISSDDEEDGVPKTDIDKINEVVDITDDEGPESSTDPGRRISRNYGVQPIRLKREPPEKADSKKDITVALHDEDEEPLIVPGQRKGKARAKDVEVVQTTRRWRGVYDDEEDEVRVKDEPKEDEDMLDDAHANEELPVQDQDAPQKPQKRKAKARIKPDAGPKATEYHTKEEIQEWDRRQRDLATLSLELGTINTKDNVDAATAASGEPLNIRDENVYLFQFPPILPDLILTSELVKEEQENADAEAPLPEPVPAPTPTKIKGKGKEKEKAKEVIKIEDDAPDIAKEKKERPAKLASGLLGKMRVHQSGKVTLDWGGTSMQVNMGLKATFFEDAVMTKVLPPGVIGETGEATAVGSVRGKFVVTPDFHEIFGKTF